MLNASNFDGLDFISESGRKYLRQIAQEIAFGSVVLFAGAGLSCNALTRDGGSSRMPRWRDLAERLRERLDQDLQGSTDPLKIADYFETKLRRATLIEAVREAIRDEEHVPGEVHRTITKLDFEEIITTNYDTLLERAFREQFIEPQVVVKGQDLVSKRRPPRIIKMHGCLELNRSGLVVTGSDFLSYAETHPWVQVFVTQMFVQSTVLFLGFGLNDPAFQAINERVLSLLGRDKARLAFSFQHKASKTEVEFWKKRQVQIIDLYSGESTQLDDKARVQKVLNALFEFQREQKRWPRRRNRELLDLPPKEDAQDQPVALETLRLLAGARSDSELEALQAGGTGRILEICARKAIEKHKSDADVRSVLRELVLLFKRICRMDDIESPGIQMVPLQWAPIRDMTDLLVDFRPQGGPQDPLGGDLALNLRVLAALLSLKLLVMAPHLAVESAKFPSRDWSPEERDPSLARKIAAARFLAALDRVERSCLDTQDMQIRSRLISLSCLFGPLLDLAALVNDWLNEAANEKPPTPDEYRLLPLSFYKIPEQMASQYQKAAESLWSRQMLNETSAGGWRIESAFRYRYLRRAAPEIQDWTGVRLHGERLARVLGQLELDPGPADSKEKSPSLELLATLQEINRGWMFGCASPDALERAWEWSEDKIGKRKAAEVSWEALIVLTLPIEGKRLFEQRQDLLRQAWNVGNLDTNFLVGYLAQRIVDGSFEAPAAEIGRSGDSPFGCYECGVAHLVRWLGERIPYEQKDSELRKAMEAMLLNPKGQKKQSPLAQWLCKTRQAEVRSCLLDALLALRPHAGPAVHAVLRDWISARLQQPPQSSTLQLSVLDPSPTDLNLEPHEVAILLAHAQAPQVAGTPFRNDLLKWLVHWAEQERLENQVLAGLALQIQEILSEGRRDQSLDWLWLIAEVRQRPRLCQMVGDLIQRAPEGSTGLFTHMKGKLMALPQEKVKPLQDKGVLLKFFGPFAEEFDEEMSKFVEVSFSSDRLGPETRNDAAELLTALLQMAPPELRMRSAASWRAALSRLIQQGAIGRGLSRELLAELDPATRQALQDNLIARLARDEDSEPPQIIADLVEQVAEKIRLAAGSEPLADLEQELIHGAQSRAEALALFSLHAATRLCRELPAFLTRNRARIRRTRLFVERRGGFRKPGRFAELLEELRQIEEGPEQPVEATA